MEVSHLKIYLYLGLIIIVLNKYSCFKNIFFRGGNAYGSDKNTVQQDIEKMKAKEEELDNLILNTGKVQLIDHGNY